MKLSNSFLRSGRRMDNRKGFFRLGLMAALVLGALAAARGPLGQALAQGSAAVNWWVVAGGGAPSTGGGVTMNDTLGQPVIGPSSGGTVSLAAGYWYPGSGPTAVSLLSFDAVPQGAAILLTWETADEVDNLGFNLYRAGSPTGPLARLNDELIPTLVPPGSTSGAVYEWLDEVGLVPGQLYFYWLEDVDIYGHTTLHGPLQATVPVTQLPTLHVPLIQMEYRNPDDGHSGTVQGAITIAGQDNAPVPGAKVAVQWTLPDGTTRDDQATTQRGTVEFELQTKLEGTFRLCVIGVVNDGYTYDPLQNPETCHSMAVP
jgi:hypothetical protein